MKKFAERMGDWARKILACCDRDEPQVSPPMNISGPFGFRHEQLNLAGIADDQLQSLRERTTADHNRLMSGLTPLASSPSGHFAERPVRTPNAVSIPVSTGHAHSAASMPSTAYSTRETAVARISQTSPVSTRSPGGTRFDRARAHGRRISDSIRHSMVSSSRSDFTAAGEARGPTTRDRALETASGHEMESLLDSAGKSELEEGKSF